MAPPLSAVLLLLLLLLGPAGPAGPAPTAAAPAADGAGVSPAATLQAVNAVRAAHGAPALAWGADLAASCQAWTDALAAREPFALEHSRAPYGENLAAFFVRAPAQGARPQQPYVDAAVAAWADEARAYDYASPGFASGTGHFTQVVADLLESASATAHRVLLARCCAPLSGSYRSPEHQGRDRRARASALPTASHSRGSGAWLSHRSRN